MRFFRVSIVKESFNFNLLLILILSLNILCERIYRQIWRNENKESLYFHLILKETKEWLVGTYFLFQIVLRTKKYRLGGNCKDRCSEKKNGVYLKEIVILPFKTLVLWTLNPTQPCSLITSFSFQAWFYNSVLKLCIW